MGYKTHYRIGWDDETGKGERAFLTWRKSSQDLRYTFPLDAETEIPVTETEEAIKWYGHMDDLKALSASCPEVLFTLRGEGEKAGDIWAAYFLGGKGYKAQAEIVVPGFNAEKLDE